MLLLFAGLAVEVIDALVIIVAAFAVAVAVTRGYWCPCYNSCCLCCCSCCCLGLLVSLLLLLSLRLPSE